MCFDANKRYRQTDLVGDSTRSRSYFTTDSQSVSQYVLVSSALVGLATRYYFLSECCCLKFAVLYLWGRPLRREDWSAICNVITHWSESLRTRNHALLSHLRLPQPGGPGSRIYIPRNRVAQLYARALAGLRWRYSNPPHTWRDRSLYISPSGIGNYRPVLSSEMAPHRYKTAKLRQN
jgi:hypothetical protein